MRCVLTDACAYLLANMELKNSNTYFRNLNRDFNFYDKICCNYLALYLYLVA